MGVEEEALLRSIGLTHNESLVYLALASLGPGGASDVAEKSGVQRTLVYDTLKRLVEKGLVSQADIDGRKVFKAAEPSRLKASVEERQKSVLENASKLVGLLEKTYAFSAKPTVEMYTGVEGLKTVFTQEIEELPEGGVLKVQRMQPGVAIWSPVFMAWWHKRRIQKKIVLRGIVDLSPQAFQRGKELEKLPFTELRYLSEALPSPVTYHVFGSKASVMAMAEEESLGIIIESKVVAKSLEENFDVIWASLEKPSAVSAARKT